MLFVTDRAKFSGPRLAVDVVVAALALTYAAWAIVGSGYQATAWAFLLLIAGIPVHIWVKHRKQRSMPAAELVIPEEHPVPTL